MSPERDARYDSAERWRPRLALIALLLAGFSALIDEVVWARLLTLTFGVTVYASAAVLSAFMAGLALGSWVGGRLAEWTWRCGSTSALPSAKGRRAHPICKRWNDATAGASSPASATIGCRMGFALGATKCLSGSRGAWWATNCGPRAGRERRTGMQWTTPPWSPASR